MDNAKTAGAAEARLRSTILSWTAAAAYLAIAAASLVSKPYRPATGLIPGAFEHMAAYFVLGVLSALAARGRLSFVWLAIANAVYAGALEAMQMAVPGRVASGLDALASATGSALGIAAVAVLAARRRTT